MENKPKIVVVNQFESQINNAKKGWQIIHFSNNSSSNTKKINKKGE